MIFPSCQLLGHRYAENREWAGSRDEIFPDGYNENKRRTKDCKQSQRGIKERTEG